MTKKLANNKAAGKSATSQPNATKNLSPVANNAAKQDAANVQTHADNTKVQGHPIDINISPKNDGNRVDEKIQRQLEKLTSVMGEASSRLSELINKVEEFGVSIDRMNREIEVKKQRSRVVSDDDDDSGTPTESSSGVKRSRDRNRREEDSDDERHAKKFKKERHYDGPTTTTRTTSTAVSVNERIYLTIARDVVHLLRFLCHSQGEWTC